MKIRDIFEPISGILRKIYGIFKAIFRIAWKMERVLKEMRGVSLPISRIAWKTRGIRETRGRKLGFRQRFFDCFHCRS